MRVEREGEREREREIAASADPQLHGGNTTALVRTATRPARKLDKQEPRMPYLQEPAGAKSESIFTPS